MLEQCLRFAGSNEIVLGIATLCGIAGLMLTIVVTVRTEKIGKILRYNQITSQYNKERRAFQNAFEGHRKSIIEDGLQSDKLLKDILKNVEEYRSKFQEILSMKDRFTLFMFVRLLKKESNQVNYNSVCNYLAILSGRLSKKEDKRNG